MSKSIKIDDATYEIVAKFAQQEDRPFSNALSRLVKLGLNNTTLQVPDTPPVPVADMGKAIKKAKKLTLDDLTEKDLATAKVTFNDRPDFKEPEKWDKHAWPTV